MATTSEASLVSRSSIGLYLGISAGTAITAAVATYLSVVTGLSLWGMFIGWVAFFTGAPTLKAVAKTLVCILLGLAIGAVAAMAVGALMPIVGRLAFACVVFVVAFTVVSLRSAPFINNVLAYFVGLTTFFASNSAPRLFTLVSLGAACALGLGAGWVAFRFQHMIQGSRTQHL